MIHGKTFIAPLLDFIFPPVCPACDQKLKTYVPLCDGCTKKLEKKLEIQMQSGPQDFSHLDGIFYFDDAVTFWKYSDELDRLVQLVKYHGRKHLGEVLGRIAGKALAESALDKIDLIVPVPLHRKRFRKRGYNQSEWIAKGVSGEMCIPVCPQVLKRNRNTQTQTRLDAAQRQENVDNAFTIPKSSDMKGKSILILDDVITTGATLNACAKVLKACGAERVVGIGLARPVTFHI